MIRFWDFKLIGAPPLLSLVVRRRRAHRVAISFGDNVRVASTPLTVSLGLAGLTGQVYGETTPSVTGVEVVGGAATDYAINVRLDGRREALWFAPELLEFVDHAPGTEAVIGSKRFVRSASGEWVEDPPPPKPSRPWWRFW